jgi:hypothetical protein
MRENAGSSKSHEREKFWRKVIAGQPRSGLSVTAWCGKHGVSSPSFYVWRQRLAKRGAARQVRRLPLVPVEIISPGTDERVVLEIELPSQVRVQVRSGCELELLRQVLTMLGADRREAPGC